MHALRESLPPRSSSFYLLLQCNSDLLHSICDFFSTDQLFSRSRPSECFPLAKLFLSSWFSPARWAACPVMTGNLNVEVYSASTYFKSAQKNWLSYSNVKKNRGMLLICFLYFNILATFSLSSLWHNFLGMILFRTSFPTFIPIWAQIF